MFDTYKAEFKALSTSIIQTIYINETCVLSTGTQNLPLGLCALTFVQLQFTNRFHFQTLKGGHLVQIITTDIKVAETNSAHILD